MHRKTVNCCGTIRHVEFSFTISYMRDLETLNKQGRENVFDIGRFLKHCSSVAYLKQLNQSVAIMEECI